MLEEESRLIEEICQIKKQYVDEVGHGRRVWPRSVKDRIRRLDELGVPALAVAKQTGIPYCTILLWRHRERKEINGAAFHELRVESKLPPISKSLAVTVPKFEMQSSQGLRLKTPDGFVIEGLDHDGIILMMAKLSKAGRHAS